MSDEATTKKLTVNILTEVMTDPEGRKVLQRVFHELRVMSDGELVPVYGGTSAKGYGSFLCEFMPQAAVEKLVAECGVIFDEFEVWDKTGHRRVKLKDRPGFAEQRDWFVQEMAEIAVHTLLTNFLDKLREALRMNFEESRAVAHATLAVMLSAGFEHIGVKSKADAREDIAALQRMAATAEKKHAARLIGFWPQVAVEGRKGRPPGSSKVTTARVRNVLRKYPHASAESMAEFLYCQESTITRWAKSTEWKTWSKAKRALLEKIKERIK